jgi:ribonuclease P protein component
VLPKTIKKRAEFLRVSKEGVRIKTNSFIALCCKNNEKIPLVGYTASRKIGKAVVRNKAKRRLRSLVREFEAKFNPGCSFVFIAKSGTAVARFSDLRSDFEYCLTKSRTYLKENNAT